MSGRMLVCGVLALALLAVTPATGGVGGRKPTTEPRLYGINWRGSLGLVRVNRDTLRPLSGPRVPLAGEPLGWSFAPGRSRLVLGSTARGAKLRLIDLRAMRVLGDVRVTRRGSGIATAWARPSRVLAVVVTPGCCGAGDTIVAGVDPGRRRVVWRRALGGSLQAGERSRRGLLLVLGPRGRSVGPSRLVQVGPEGRIRTAPLPEILSGTGSDGAVAESWEPGLAIDRSRGRAFVVQARAPVAEVDLRTFEARSRAVEAAPPAAHAPAGATRHALWLGRGVLAVTGFDARRKARDTPAGLTLIDTRRWRARTIDRHATDAALVSGTLLASAYLFHARSQTTSGNGLTGYSVAGRRRFRRYGTEPITGVTPLGTRALVGRTGGLTLIDARTGRRLRHYPRFAMSLISGDAPVY